VVWIGGPFQLRDMSGHAVVVIEKAITDEDLRPREIGTKTRNKRLDLRQPGRGPGPKTANYRHNSD
jgi:hypothetical protein